jgi:hypothetical protein
MLRGTRFDVCPSVRGEWAVGMTLDGIMRSLFDFMDQWSRCGPVRDPSRPIPSVHTRSELWTFGSCLYGSLILEAALGAGIGGCNSGHPKGAVFSSRLILLSLTVRLSFAQCTTLLARIHSPLSFLRCELECAWGRICFNRVQQV